MHVTGLYDDYTIHGVDFPAVSPVGGGAFVTNVFFISLQDVLRDGGL
jgi:hypothetical protein